MRSTHFNRHIQGKWVVLHSRLIYLSRPSLTQRCGPTPCSPSPHFLSSSPTLFSSPSLSTISYTPLWPNSFLITISLDHLLHSVVAQLLAVRPPISFVRPQLFSHRHLSRPSLTCRCGPTPFPSPSLSTISYTALWPNSLQSVPPFPSFVPNSFLIAISLDHLLHAVVALHFLLPIYSIFFVYSSVFPSPFHITTLYGPRLQYICAIFVVLIVVAVARSLRRCSCRPGGWSRFAPIRPTRLSLAPYRPLRLIPEIPPYYRLQQHQKPPSSTLASSLLPHQALSQNSVRIS
jgi:hypothetical protein